MLEKILSLVDSEKLFTRVEQLVNWVDKKRETSKCIARYIELLDDSVATIILWAMGHKDLTI